MRSKINKNKVRKYCEEIFPKLISELEERLPRLETLEPKFCQNIYLQEVDLAFTFRNSSGYYAYEHQSRELRDNLEKMSEIIGQSAEKYGLIISKNHDKVSHRGFFAYIFKPNYAEFVTKK